jgi:hypothetical protein
MILEVAMKDVLVTIAIPVLLASTAGNVVAADETKVKSATRRVEEGAKMIGDGKVGSGVEETAKGIGNTVVEGAKYTGEKLKESGQAAEPKARDAWSSLKEGASAFGASVKSFFSRLFSK